MSGRAGLAGRTRVLANARSCRTPLDAQICDLDGGLTTWEPCRDQTRGSMLPSHTPTAMMSLRTVLLTYRSFGGTRMGTTRRKLLLAPMLVLATATMLPASLGYEWTELCVANAVDMEGSKAGLKCQTWSGTTADGVDVDGLDACLTFCCAQRFQVTHVEWKEKNNVDDCVCGVCEAYTDETDGTRHLYLLDPGVPGIASCAAGQYNSDGHTTSVPPLLPCLADAAPPLQQNASPPPETLTLPAVPDAFSPVRQMHIVSALLDVGRGEHDGLNSDIDIKILFSKVDSP